MDRRTVLKLLGVGFGATVVALTKELSNHKGEGEADVVQHIETWVIVTARTSSQVPSNLDTILAHPGVVGVSLAQAWDQIETSPGIYDFSAQQAVLDICRATGKKFAARFRAGQHTPGWNMGRTWVPTGGLAQGLVLPCPFTTTGSTNPTFLAAFQKYVWAQRRWAETRLQAGDILHFTQFGGSSAEFFCPIDPKVDDSITKLSGYSQSSLIAAHVNLVKIAQSAQGVGPWSIEFPLGGYTPAWVPFAERDQLATMDRSFVQLNWLDDRTTDTTITNWRYGLVPLHGLQMIHDGDYNWTQVYANAAKSGAAYVEVYLKSFQSAGAPDLYTAIASYA